MAKIINYASGFAVILLICTNAIAAARDNSSFQALLDQDISLSLAPVKSTSDLETYIKNTPDHISPLNKLPPQSRNTFIESLTFNKNGLTGFNYAELQKHLTASEIYQIMSLFGAQHTTKLMKGIKINSSIDEAIMTNGASDKGGPLCPTQPCDYSDYRCESRATCGPSIFSICLRTC